MFDAVTVQIHAQHPAAQSSVRYGISSMQAILITISPTMHHCSRTIPVEEICLIVAFSRLAGWLKDGIE